MKRAVKPGEETKRATNIRYLLSVKSCSSPQRKRSSPPPCFGSLPWSWRCWADTKTIATAGRSLGGRAALPGGTGGPAHAGSCPVGDKFLVLLESKMIFPDATVEAGLRVLLITAPGALTPAATPLQGEEKGKQGLNLFSAS